MVTAWTTLVARLCSRIDQDGHCIFIVSHLKDRSAEDREEGHPGRKLSEESSATTTPKHGTLCPRVDLNAGEIEEV